MSGNAGGNDAGGGGGRSSKQDAMQVAKREKRMKLQKAMECFRKVRWGAVAAALCTVVGSDGWVQCRWQAQKIIRSPHATRKDLEEGVEYLNAAVAMRPTNGRYYFARCGRLAGGHVADCQPAHRECSAAQGELPTLHGRVPAGVL